MKIRRFVAKDMRTALANVSAELGNEAAILSSNKITGGVEVVAATDYEESLLQPRNKHQQGSSAVDSKEPSVEQYISSPTNTRESLSQKSEKESASYSHKPNGRVDKEWSNNFPSPNQAESLSQVAEKSNAKSSVSSFPQFEWSQEPTLVAMREELNMLRSLLQQQVAQITGSKRLQESPLSVALEQELAKLGLANAITDSVVEQCGFETNFDAAWQKALGLVAKSIDTPNQSIIERGGVVALVGPTGVGKTTTLAKLAAEQVLKDGPDSLGLITADNYRIAAHEQLRTYGKILQVPVRTVDDQASLHAALDQFSDRKLVLIDTAGMSKQNERMELLISALNAPHLAIEKYLVLSATAQTQVLKDALELFSCFNLAGSIITKLDEAASLGEILSTIIINNLSVAYTTDGQRVPEDIRLARAHHLVSKMVWLARNHQEDRTLAAGVA